MGNAPIHIPSFFGRKSAIIIAYENALSEGMKKEELLRSEVDKLHKKLNMVEGQVEQYEAYGREQQSEADEARREAKRLSDFIAEQQSLGQFNDPKSQDILNGKEEGLVEQLQSELRSTKQKLELAEHALLTPEVLSARKQRSTKLQDLEDSFRGAKVGNPVRLTPVSVQVRQRKPPRETEERRRERLKKARETPIQEFKPWESMMIRQNMRPTGGDAWQ